MATVKCALGKRGLPSHEWNDGKKDRIRPEWRNSNGLT